MSLATVTKILELEEKCKRLASPVGESETTRCERAERMIKAAIDQYQSFPNGIKNNIQIFAQGSYKNGTNIRTDSDVDVAVCLTEPFFADYSKVPGKNDHSYGFVTPAYTFPKFRSDVERAMLGYFGATEVDTNGNKSIKIRQNTARVGADVVPSFQYRRFLPDGTYQIGTKFYSRDGAQEVVNWPAWAYNNGVAKNKSTSFRFKKVVRILKALRRDMSAPASETPSFLIESLVWNVPDTYFAEDGLLANCHAVLGWLHTQLQNPISATLFMTEINSLKELFSGKQAWNVTTAYAFVSAAMRELQP